MDADEKWIDEFGMDPDNYSRNNMRAAIARGRERGRAEGKAERDQLLAWRSDVTVALGRPQGAFCADVPKLIREVVADRDRLAKRVEEMEREPFGAAEELGRRLAATDARLTALVSIVERYLGDEISGDEAAPMIAALRAPGVELRQCPECDCDPAALATARRARVGRGRK